MKLERLAPRLFFVGVVLAAGYLSVLSYLLLTGPRMKTQTHVRAYEAPMRVLSARAVAVTDAIPPVPTVEEAAKMSCPIVATDANVARGKVYYGYYCLACHGERGDGNGPVGEAFVPTPADLRSPKVQQQSAGQLYRAMLASPSHGPVMEYTIPFEHRWPIVLFLRTFKSLQPRPHGLTEAK